MIFEALLFLLKDVIDEIAVRLEVQLHEALKLELAVLEVVKLPRVLVCLLHKYLLKERLPFKRLLVSVSVFSNYARRIGTSMTSCSHLAGIVLMIHINRLPLLYCGLPAQSVEHGELLLLLSEELALAGCSMCAWKGRI